MTHPSSSPQPDRPQTVADRVLTRVVGSLRLRSALYCRILGGRGWGLRLPAVDGAAVHIVREGACSCTLTRGSAKARVEAGDILLLPRGTAHTMRDGPRSKTMTIDALTDRIGRAGVPSITLGSSPVRAEILCAVFYFERRLWDPLLMSLPDLVVLRRHDYARSLTTRLLDCAEHELAHPRAASALVLSRLGDVLFIELMRTVARRGGSADRPGWLAMLQDARLSRALLAIHEQPAAGWTVDQLAALSRLSRTTFNERFRRALGASPLQYLTRWRVITAASYLADTDWKVSEVAKTVGYATEASFSRAFKQIVGIPPGRYRTSRRAAPSP